MSLRFLIPIGVFLITFVITFLVQQLLKYRKLYFDRCSLDEAFLLTPTYGEYLKQRVVEQALLKARILHEEKK